MPRKMGRTIEEEVREYAGKLQKGVLPPDPARFVQLGLRTPLIFEHVLPIPSIVEGVHSEHVEPLIENLPRLPMTMDFPIVKWEEWRVE